jgi:hypothetical protein
MNILWYSVLLSLSAVAAPLAVTASSGHGFDLSFGATAVSVVLSAVGWLVALWLLRHPLFDEMLSNGGMVMRKLEAAMSLRSSKAIFLDKRHVR